MTLAAAVSDPYGGRRVASVHARTRDAAHRVHIIDVSSWSMELLGFDARRDVTDDDWLATPAQRLAREVMRLCLLLARRYPPYGKWLGTAFAALPDPGGVAAALCDPGLARRLAAAVHPRGPIPAGPALLK